MQAPFYWSKLCIDTVAFTFTSVYAFLIIYQSPLHYHRPANQNKVMQAAGQSSIHQSASQLATHPPSQRV